jgi:hypothetical protein
MKSFVRLGATVGMISSAIVSAFVAFSPAAIALTNEEIKETLQTVPVFTITDANGSPLISAPPEEGGTAVTGVFISREDAESFLAGLQQGNPELANQVQVVPVSLAEVFEIALAGQANDLEFVFIPMRQQVETAVQILQQEGENISAEQFQGVPLFLARSSMGDGGYLTMQRGEEEVIPVFFKQEELQTMLNRLSEAQPSLANTIEIQVINLEGLIGAMQTTDDPDFNQILLVPPSETLDYIQMLREQNQQ